MIVVNVCKLIDAKDLQVTVIKGIEMKTQS